MAVSEITKEPDTRVVAALAGISGRGFDSRRLHQKASPSGPCGPLFLRRAACRRESKGGKPNCGGCESATEEGALEVTPPWEGPAPGALGPRATQRADSDGSEAAAALALDPAAEGYSSKGTRRHPRAGLAARSFFKGLLAGGSRSPRGDPYGSVRGRDEEAAFAAAALELDCAADPVVGSRQCLEARLLVDLHKARCDMHQAFN